MPRRSPKRIRAAGAVTAAAFVLLAALSACSSGPTTPTAAGHGPPPSSSPAASSSAPPASPPVTTLPVASPSGHQPGSPPSSGVPIGGGPNIAVVRLSARFAPATLHLGVGQQFVVIVSKHVKVSGSGISGSCTAAAATRFSSPALSLRCSDGSYMYTARRAGKTVLAVTVRPDCLAGAMCPQWVTRAQLTLSVS